jgi:hypothetical protein
MSTTLVKAFSGVASTVDNFDVRLLDNLTDVNLVKIIKADPSTFAPVLKKMDDADVSNILKRMDDSDKARILDQIDPDGVRKLDGAKPDDNTLTLAAGAAALGAAYYIDNKYDKADEKFKDCMIGCLPHNWDEYDQGSLDKSELKYSTVESLDEYGVTPIDNQPYCTSQMNDCGEYCEKRCESESEVDLPFGLDRPFEALDDTWDRFMGSFPEFNPMYVGGISSVSLCCLIVMVLLMTTLRS